MGKSNQTINFLIDDHKRIKGLFRQFEASGSRAPVMRFGICQEIFMELEIHTYLEERFVYPTIQNAFKNEIDKSLISDALKDHQHLRFWVKQLRSTPLEDEKFNSKMGEVIEEIEFHITKEESDLFPRVKSEIEDQVLDSLIGQLKKTRSELLSSPDYKNSRPDKVQDPNGGEQKRVKHVA